MCGIAGFLDPHRRFTVETGEKLVRDMARAIAHRGPDGEGVYVDADAEIALGHRRLSIIDLSGAGSQPMSSADGRWVITYNGEIYNFEEMRALLEEQNGVRAWRGHSDTEVLVEAIARRGFESALKLTNGMFAIGAWDRRQRLLYLARDRMGEKPLYYGWQGRTFLFASELKALAVHPDFSRRIDPAAVGLLMRYAYVPSPLCIYRDLAQLRPGHYLRISSDAGVGAAPSISRYWALPEPAPEPNAADTAIEELDNLLGDAVKLRMRSDVPLGAFLSGGIDSSTIAGLMQAHSNVPIRTYSIGFNEASYNEARFAREVARHIGSVHTELYVEPKDALDVIPALPEIYDEPFPDSSQIPTYLLCKLTRQHVKVSLSGDGGDELFGGYGRYFNFEKRWSERIGWAGPLRPAARCVLEAMPAWSWNLPHKIAPKGLREQMHPHRIKRIAGGIGARSQQEFYEFLSQYWAATMASFPPADGRRVFLEQHDLATFADPFLGMMYLDAGSYLPDDILVKVDRASMAVGLESRIPLLDHRVVEFAAKLPLDLKRRAETGKWILRRVLDRYVPQKLIDRPKQGFGMPVKDWLRGPLKEWGEDLLEDRDTVIGQLVDLRAVRSVWREHLRGEVDHSYRLWIVFMLVAWARLWRPV